MYCRMIGNLQFLDAYQDSKAQLENYQRLLELLVEHKIIITN